MDIYPVPKRTKDTESRESSVAVLVGCAKARGETTFARFAAEQIRLVHECRGELLPGAVY